MPAAASLPAGAAPQEGAHVCNASPPHAAPPQPAATPAAALAAPAALALAAVSVAPVVDLSDITLTGGSRSSFHGRFPRLQLRGIPPLAALAARAALAPGGAPAPTPAAAAPASALAPAPTPAAAAAAAFWAAPCGLGLGLVTQEAWYHPEVPGSAAVTYHEGLGHALAMPHPSVRQDMCVMDLGMYQGRPLMELEVRERERECVCVCAATVRAALHTPWRVWVAALRTHREPT